MSTLTDSCNFLYIHHPFVNMRQSPSFESKIVSQAIFSERISVKEKEKEWSLIVTPDGYSGWAPSHSFVLQNQPYKTDLLVCRLSAHLYHLQNIEYGPSFTLPYGSCLKSLDHSDPRWIKVALPCEHEYYIQKGDVAGRLILKTPQELIQLSLHFLGIPYTWGGRSSFGYDCSGFIQMLYQHIGISLQRDSNQQALDDRFTTININSLKHGDLLFFANEREEIKHVGMSLGKNSFIHATSRENQPWIRISHLSDFEWSGDAQATYSNRLARRLKDQNKGIFPHQEKSFYFQ